MAGVRCVGVASPFVVGILSILSLLLCELTSLGLLEFREGTGLLPLLSPLTARRSVADLLVFCEESVVGGDDLSSNHELSVEVDLLRCRVCSSALPSLLEFSDDGPLSVVEAFCERDRLRRLRSLKNAGIALRSERPVSDVELCKHEVSAMLRVSWKERCQRETSRASRLCRALEVRSKVRSTKFCEAIRGRSCNVPHNGTNECRGLAIVCSD